jgi:hypothetical protein
MALSIFDNGKKRPGEHELAATLGKSSVAWHVLTMDLAKQHGLVAQWNFGGPKYGWSLRLVLKKRNILYLIPGKGSFLVGIVFGDKALAALRESDVPATVIEIFDKAPRYGEGTGVRLTVKTTKDAATINKLMVIKLAH